MSPRATKTLARLKTENLLWEAELAKVVQQRTWRKASLDTHQVNDALHAKQKRVVATSTFYLSPC